MFFLFPLLLSFCSAFLMSFSFASACLFYFLSVFPSFISPLIFFPITCHITLFPSSFSSFFPFQISSSNTFLPFPLLPFSSVSLHFFFYFFLCFIFIFSDVLPFFVFPYFLLTYPLPCFLLSFMPFSVFRLLSLLSSVRFPSFFSIL